MRSVAHQVVTVGPKEGEMAGVRGCLRGESLNIHRHIVVKETGRKPNEKDICSVWGQTQIEVS